MTKLTDAIEDTNRDSIIIIKKISKVIVEKNLDF